MSSLFQAAFLLLLFLIPSYEVCAADGGIRSNGSEGRYVWKTDPVGRTAELVTLSCHQCLSESDTGGETPLVSVLRDTLGQSSADGDRISYVWLLTAPHRSLGQKALSGVPFFYWQVGRTGSELTKRDITPQANITAPENSILPNIARKVTQWTALDPFTIWVRATSRSYSANAGDDERLRLDQAIAYLRLAPPASNGDGLSEEERNTVIARLLLRQNMLGGLATDAQAAKYGEQSVYEAEQIRSRNWEMLRLCAEKTGLYFEPLDLGGAKSQYAVLWFQVGGIPPQTGTSLKPIWKLLNIQDPYDSNRTNSLQPASYQRSLDALGRLLPEGQESVRHVQLVPLGFYSLNYSKLPLLLVDFRDRLHVRRHELTQRAVNEITSGVLGLSHFTNWYYYAGAMGYDLVAGRHGAAVSMSERLDCYAEFGVHLGLDRQLDPRLSKELRARIGSLRVSPFSDDVNLAAERARQRYNLLLSQSEPESDLMRRLNKDRRVEQAGFGQSVASSASHSLLHVATFGIYTERVPAKQLDLAVLEAQRRFGNALSRLQAAVRNGTDPEAISPASELSHAVEDMQQTLPVVRSAALRQRATVTLARLAELSSDSRLQSECRSTIAASRIISDRPQVATNSEPPSHGSSRGVSAASLGIAEHPRVLSARP